MTTNFAQSTPDCGIVRIEVQRPDGWSGTFELQNGQTLTVGAKESCGVHLPGAGMAPIHCILRLTDGQLWVQDWYSSGGTMVGGELISGEICVPAGADIRVGEYTILPSLGNGRSATTSEVQEAPPAPVQDPVEEPEVASADDDISHASSTGPAADHEVESAANPEPDTRELADEAPEREPAQDTPAAQDTPTAQESTFDELAYLDDMFDDTPQSGFADSFEQETIELLRAEVEQLQCELAEREQELEEVRAQSAFDGESPATTESDGDSSALVARMEELLEELERSDDRTSQLEEVLRCSEEATRAEQDERRQLEAWFNDIERRVGQRESEGKAEQEVLQQRLDEMAQKRRRLEEHLRQNLATDNVSEKHNRELQRLNEENEQLRKSLEKSEEERRQLESKQHEVGTAVVAEQVQEQVDVKLREEQIRVAQERAVIARQQAEMASMRNEMEKLSEAKSQKGCDIDARVRVFREHLREIHSQEQDEQETRSLTQRVADLWRRLDGR